MCIANTRGNIEQISKPWNWYFGFWHATVRNRNETGNINCEVVFFKCPVSFLRKRKWKFERLSVSNFRFRFWKSVLSQRFMRNFWKSALSHRFMRNVLNLERRGPQTSKNRKNMTKYSLAKNNLKICRFENGTFGKRRKLKLLTCNKRRMFPSAFGPAGIRVQGLGDCV